jgi:serine acetyltransferase
VNSTILPYVEIGAGALIGSGSVVTRDLPANCVAYGNPARPHKMRTDLRDIADRFSLVDDPEPDLPSEPRSNGNGNNSW